MPGDSIESTQFLQGRNEATRDGHGLYIENIYGKLNAFDLLSPHFAVYHLDKLKQEYRQNDGMGVI
jgi:hypothetical protein